MKRVLSLLLALALCGVLAGCGGQGGASSSVGSDTSAPGVFMPRMFMADGVLYEDTGRESTVEGRCGNMDGEITSSVESWQQPEEDGQASAIRSAWRRARWRSSRTGAGWCSRRWSRKPEGFALSPATFSGRTVLKQAVFAMSPPDTAVSPPKTPGHSAGPYSRPRRRPAADRPW